MIRRELVIGVDDLARVDGAVVTRDFSLGPGAGVIRRGTVVDASTRAMVANLVGRRLIVTLAEPGEVGQPEASGRLAATIIGPGIHAAAPHQGQVILSAARDGLARVDARAVDRINRAGPALIATTLDGRVLRAGETVAVVKAARLWVASDALDRVEQLVGNRTVLQVAPFRARRAAFLVGARIRSANVVAAEESLGATLGRFGSVLGESARVPDDPDVIATAMSAQISRGASILLVAGSIVLDPGDPFLAAVERLGGEVVCRGAPIDPGTMFWVANLGPAVCFGLASCEMYGRRSVLDLVLPYALADQAIDDDLIAGFGYGGLLDQTFGARPGSGTPDQLGIAHATGDQGEADETDDDPEPQGAEADDQRRRGGNGGVVGDPKQEQQTG